jgi:hypothetical protein
MPDQQKLPAYVDFWPVSFATRLEARAMARRLMTDRWRFRAIKLLITVRVGK